MRHEVIRLPETGVELEIYLTDNRAVEPERRRPLALIFPGGAYAWRSDRGLTKGATIKLKRVRAKKIDDEPALTEQKNKETK